jgi:hypothetical protein
MFTDKDLYNLFITGTLELDLCFFQNQIILDIKGNHKELLYSIFHKIIEYLSKANISVKYNNTNYKRTLNREGFYFLIENLQLIGFSIREAKSGSGRKYFNLAFNTLSDITKFFNDLVELLKDYNDRSVKTFKDFYK